MLLYYFNNIKQTLSHIAKLAHLHVFIWKIFISPKWGLWQNQKRFDLGSLAYFSDEDIIFLYEFF